MERKSRVTVYHYSGILESRQNESEYIRDRYVSPTRGVTNVKSSLRTDLQERMPRERYIDNRDSFTQGSTR